MLEFFLLGCTGVVVFLHGANFFFHYLSKHVDVRSLRCKNFSYQGPRGCMSKAADPEDLDLKPLEASGKAGCTFTSLTPRCIRVGSACARSIVMSHGFLHNCQSPPHYAIN